MEPAEQPIQSLKPDRATLAVRIVSAVFADPGLAEAVQELSPQRIDRWIEAGKAGLAMQAAEHIGAGDVWNAADLALVSLARALRSVGEPTEELPNHE
ncbi:MAG: hypothetical protein D8M59_16565 [Planctomycetes bacterium]|nr:hypothetical protein [Planctomycetota bacterium]NOG53167.1 hypothetical protein [Planctomycetota bacterium]